MEPTAGSKLRVLVIKCCNLLLQRQLVSWLRERPGLAGRSLCNNVSCTGFLSAEGTLNRSVVLGEIIKGYLQLQLYITWSALVEMQRRRLYTRNIPWLPVNRITMEALQELWASAEFLKTWRGQPCRISSLHRCCGDLSWGLKVNSVKRATVSKPTTPELIHTLKHYADEAD